ncbi:MAG TPA: alpha/beta family hydrolase [Clostridia bacterium]|nr:alpha/beta family hydrolase [Clostridia bacterium]
MYNSVQEFVGGPPGEARVRGFLHVPETSSGDGLVLTHGAGSNCESPLLVTLSNAFCDLGFMVLRCDLPYRQLRPHGPPPRGSADRDRHGLRNAVITLRERVAGRVFLGGHSYGGRQASMLAAAEPGLADALLLLSYPLHPPQRPNEVRTAHFPKLTTPSLFIHGARDGFATAEELTDALRLVPAGTRLLSIPGAGHELMTKRNSDAFAALVTGAFLSFSAATG